MKNNNIKKNTELNNTKDKVDNKIKKKENKLLNSEDKLNIADNIKNDDVKLLLDKQYIRNENGILGADDRSGIFIIFSIIKECLLYNIPFPSILITNFEEFGFAGAKAFADQGWIQETKQLTLF